MVLHYMIEQLALFFFLRQNFIENFIENLLARSDASLITINERTVLLAILKSFRLTHVLISAVRNSRGRLRVLNKLIDCGVTKFEMVLSRKYSIWFEGRRRTG